MAELVLLGTTKLQSRANSEIKKRVQFLDEDYVCPKLIPTDTVTDYN